VTVAEDIKVADALTRLITDLHHRDRARIRAVRELRNAAVPRNGCRVAEINPRDARWLAAELRAHAATENEHAAAGLEQIAAELDLMAPARSR